TLVCISGCENRGNDLVVLKTFHTKTAYTLTVKESQIITDLLEEIEWVKGTSDCLSDIKLEVGDSTLHYHSDCGTLNDTRNLVSYTLSIEDKHTVNEIISNYIDLSLNNIVDIVDRTKVEPDLTYNTALEYICEDDMYQYYFYNMISQYVIVTYEDGTQEDILTAIENGRATIDDLDHYGISYYAQSKLPGLLVIGSEHTIEANRAGYHWGIKQDGEISTAMIADSDHPYLAYTIQPVLYLKEQSTEVHFLFDMVPTSIRVEYYLIDDLNSGSTEPTGEFIVDISALNEANAIRVALLEGDYVYDVCASWNEIEYEGSIHYYFWTTN
ncbi:MAG: hypothetical protein IKL88_02145, partial [Erysipelotrichales bacterium]|nr:hypothetical protein [Erysipelotrichales bacterium]